MAIHSMTGFAHVAGQHDGRAWTWELKSVNGKGLDVRTRLPHGMDALEPKVRAAVQDRFVRGNVAANLTVSGPLGETRVRVNEAVLDQVTAALDLLRARVPDAAPPTLDGLLGLRGVIEVEDAPPTDEARAAFEAALLAGLDAALDDLARARKAEGARTQAVLADQVAEIARLAEAATALAVNRPDMIAARLAEQVSALLAHVPPLPAERLAQEAAVLMVKADIREELDRLASHVLAARELLAEGGAVGRRLDFLCQEFNREANTLCSKSLDGEMTRIGLSLKTVIDQLREQVQNIE